MTLELWIVVVIGYLSAGVLVSSIWKLTIGSWDEEKTPGEDSKAWLVGIGFLLWPILFVVLVGGLIYLSVEAVGKLLIRLKVG